VAARVGSVGLTLALAGVVVLGAPFALHALSLGLRGLIADLSLETYLYRADRWGSTISIFLHMVGGGLITVLAPLQLIPWLRRRWPRLHRICGYVLAGGAGLAGLGGLAYIGLRGTIGGTPMDIGFAVYGALILVAAGQTVRFARARDLTRHHAWALRLFWLAIGSWLYRVHYGLWHVATGGAATAPDFSGAFDLVQNWAFFVPYLLLVEVYLRRSRIRAGVSG